MRLSQLEKQCNKKTLSHAQPGLIFLRSEALFFGLVEPELLTDSGQLFGSRALSFRLDAVYGGILVVLNRSICPSVGMRDLSSGTELLAILSSTGW